MMKLFKRKSTATPVETTPWHRGNTGDPLESLFVGRYFIYNHTPYKVLEVFPESRSITCININNVLYKEIKSTVGGIRLVIPINSAVFPRKQCSEVFDGHRCLWYEGHGYGSVDRHNDDEVSWHVAR